MEGEWWRDAVVYQVYPRSFADSDGDGVGDIPGIRSHLDHLVELGVDAVWINPWYPSPMKDAGYDVSDFRDVEGVFGTLADADALVADAHRLGLRVLLDIVPNHTSDQHPWFRAALASAPGSAERARYLFREGRGQDGEEPPNDWVSQFGGTAWTRVVEADGRPGQWYLHLFAPEQPDLDWENPEVRAEMESVLRFWFDRGVDGFRIDVAHGLVKAPGLPDLAEPPATARSGALRSTTPGSGVPGSGPEAATIARGDLHPFWDRAEVHEIYRSWRRLAGSYAEPRVFVAEAWVDSPRRLARYVRPDELHTAFNFDFSVAPWEAGHLRETIDASLAALGEVGAPATWVLANHDVVREVSRFARPQVDRQGADRQAAVTLEDLIELPADLGVGTRRARAAALLMLALPGGAYVYQGEELGLPEVEDLPPEARRDPIWEQTGHARRGRDGCRVPIPWSGDRPPYGFSPPASGASPWLPQPEDWSALTVEAESADPGSMLSLYRRALRIRRDHPALGDGSLTWLASPEGTLAFSREPGFACWVNLSEDRIELRAGPADRVLLSSVPLDPDGALPADTAAWVGTPPPAPGPISRDRTALP